MSNTFKSGFVAIIGRTNVGKSTLLNCLAEEKVAIMTHKPQTTRTAIKAIINRENSQIIFIDTPGIHKPKNKLRRNTNRYFIQCNFRGRCCPFPNRSNKQRYRKRR